MLRLQGLSKLILKNNQSLLGSSSLSGTPKLINLHPRFSMSDFNNDPQLLTTDSTPRMFKGRSQRQSRMPRSSPSPFPNRANQAQQQNTIVNIDQEYKDKFGSTKTELLDSWLEMANEDLAKECEKVGITPTDKHIENIQSLFEHLKKFDAILEGKQVQAQETTPDSPHQFNSEGFNKRPRQGERNNQFREKKEFTEDIKKAKETLASDLDRIFSKKKRRDYSASEDTNGMGLNGQESAPETFERTTKTYPPFRFDFNLLRQSLDKRSNMIDAAQPVFLQDTPQSGTIDLVFGMSPEQIDSKFSEYMEERDSALKELNIQKDDFLKMPNLTKKKVLINMDNIRQFLSNNPNQQINFLPLTESIKYGAKHLPLLTEQTLHQLSSKVIALEATGFNSQQQNDLDFHVAIAGIMEGNVSLDRSNVQQMLKDNYIDKKEGIYKNTNLENCLKHAKVIDFICNSNNDQEEVNKIKNAFYTGIRKNFHKQMIRKMNIDEKYQLLKALPSVKQGAYSSQSSLHYLLLNDMLTQETAFWQIIDKESMLDIVGRCVEMDKCRDLQSKLRGCLLEAPTYTFSIDDYQQLFKLISENRDNTVDIKLIVNNMMRRSIKSIAYVPNGKELSKFIDFFEYLYKSNPLFMAFLPVEMKFILHRSRQLGHQENLSFKDMIKLSKIMIPSLYKPTFYFSEMIRSQSQSFKHDVNNEDLLELVDQITKRVSSGEMIFEHLAMSTSKIHKNYKPYSEKTFILLQRVMKDLLGGEETASGPLQQHELDVIHKILQCEPLLLKLFRSSEQAVETLAPVVDSQLAIINQKLESYKQDNESMMLETETNNYQWQDLFNSIKNIQPLIQSQPELVEKTKNLLEKSIELLRNELFFTKSFDLDEYIKLNHAVLSSLRQFPDLHKAHEAKFVLQEIVQVFLEYTLMQKKPFILKFDKFKKNVKISKMMMYETNNKSLITKNIGALIHFLTYTNSDNNKQLATMLAQNITNGRSLVGEDLVNLFKMINKYGIADQVRPMLMIVASNLQTIDQTEVSPGQSLRDDQNFAKQQEMRHEEDLKNKKMIFNKYQGIFQNEPVLMTKQADANLGPLSKVMADILDDFTDQQVLLCMQMLGNDSIENFNENFIKKLYERFSSPSQIQKMIETSQKFFFSFAKHWPHFLKNNAILNQLIQIKGNQVLVTEQAEALEILTKKNVLQPELIETHFETFTKMKDKDHVSKYLKQFLHSCSYLGYSKIDMQKLTQIFRRIYKSPEKVELSQLLDYFVVLALSDQYYKDFDPKSVEFVDEGIKLIEDAFTGVESINVQKADSITGEAETFKLNYFKSIPTASKVYNKVLVKAQQPQLDFKEAFAEFEEVESTTSEEEKFVGRENKGGEDLTGSSESQDSSDDELELEKDLEDNIKEENLEGVAESELNDSQTQIKKRAKTLSKNADVKIYERKASEGMYSEEMEFHQYRKKKVQDLDKKSKHLLLFSNINQLNFIDINQSDVVKAWAVLFHFQSKSFASILYDEFESILMRNTIGKSKGHELYTKFYLSLMTKSHDNGYRMHLTGKCKKTGWPIDISLSLIQDQQRKMALYFFLQEEICYNSFSQSDEPLALQKLMMKHMKSISDFNVDYVTENDFYQNKMNLDKYINYIVSEKLVQGL